MAKGDDKKWNSEWDSGDGSVFWQKEWRLYLTKLQPCISHPLAWKPRKILRPPKKFEDLFSRYFHRDCLSCSKSPSMPIICLFCGELLCLDECCNTTRYRDSERTMKYTVSEIEAHSEACSSSAGLFISITSSMIIVSRANKAAIWGTVYLDSHKEEDRNLKRGKPLYMCETRLKWLEYDWAEQEWQRVYAWFNMQHQTSFINTIRECHLHHHH
uniref:E3 ubiquitin-protein ligase n=1 Tax=Caenorhabditis tropicalis TaxID=1561998 RepID=A0A1I7T3Q9_9PELO